MKKNIIVKFKDEDHSYWNGKQQYLSVNKLLSNFGFYFDRDYWMVHKAIERSIPEFYKKYFRKGFDFNERKPSPEKLLQSFKKEIESYDVVIEEIIAKVCDEWSDSAINGTKFHMDQEDKAYSLGYMINPYDGKKYTIQEKPKLTQGFDNLSNIDFLSNLRDGSYSELLIFDEKYRIAGQSDETYIETIKGVRYVDIGDHKTNGKVPKNDAKNGTCFHPIDHLNDNTYIKYQMQVSMYANMLSRFGFVPRHVGFYHYKNYDESTKKVFKLNYLGRECTDILNVHYENFIQ